MKKSLIALAALTAVAGAAQAQNVTLYGILDMGVVYGNGLSAGNVTKAASGSLSTSRFGLKGTEDLGGGLTAGFVLESELNVGSGVAGSKEVSGAAVASDSLFHRAANVSLSNNEVGSVTLGRMNRLEYDAIIAADPFGAANFGGAVRTAYISGGVIAKPDGTNVDARYSNSIKLTTASLSGLKLSYQRSLGGIAGDTSSYSSNSLGLDYSYDKLRLLGTWARNNGAGGAEVDKTYTVLGSYDFGVAKLFAGHMERQIAAGGSPKANYFGAVVPVNGQVNVMANYTRITQQGGGDGKDANVFAVGATYGLSKRTTLYSMYGFANNDGQANVYVSNLIGSPAAGKDQHALSVGVRHAF